MTSIFNFIIGLFFAAVLFIATWIGIDHVFGWRYPNFSGFFSTLGVFVIVVSAALYKFFAWAKAEVLAIEQADKDAREAQYRWNSVRRVEPLPHLIGAMDMRTLAPPFMGIRK